MTRGRRAPTGDRRTARALVVGALALTLALAAAASGAVTPAMARPMAAAVDTPTSTPTDTGTATASTTATATSTAPTSPPPSAGQGGGPGPGNATTGSSTPPVYTMAIHLTQMTPAVVTPTSTLTIKGTITNTGDATVQNAELRLLVHHSPLVTRQLVQQWGAGQIQDVGGRILDAQADLPVDLSPGASSTFTIKAPAGLLGLSMPYASIGVTLEALGDDGTFLGTHRLGLLRTYLTWQEQGDYQPLRLSWLLPLVAGPTSATGGRPEAADLATAVTTGSRLADVLAAVDHAPAGASVSVAIDPAFASDLQADSAPSGASTGTTTGSGSSPTSAAAGTGAGAGALPGAAQDVANYLAALKSGLAGHRVVQLPYGDTDLAAVSDAGDEDLLGAADAAAGTPAAGLVHQILGITPITDIAWPAGGNADGATLSAVRKAGDQAVVLAASSRPPTELADTTTTPSALAPLTGTGSALLYDDTLSTLLARTSDPSSTVLTVQRFLAETLATVGERPSRSRILLIAPPRTFDPDPTAAAALFKAVSAAPWLGKASLAQLRAGQGQDEVVDRSAAPVPASIKHSQLSAGQVRDARDVRDQATDLAAVVPGDPTLPIAATDALRLVSTSLRRHSDTAGAQVRALRAQLAREGAQVRILKTSTLNFLASNGYLPLSIANDLPHDVRGIRVVVQPTSPRLVVVAQAAPITVDADRRTTIRVRMHAVASGLVPVTAQLVTPSGLTLGTPVTVQVRVRPTDTWAFWAIGVVAGLVLLIGLFRALRRGRTRPPHLAPEVADLPEALAPELAAELTGEERP